MSIISRFPNAASLKDVNLADKLSNAASVASANKIFNEYRDQTRNLCRLSTVAKLNKKDIYSTSSSSAKVPSENKSTTSLASTVLLEDRGSDTSYASGAHEDIQVNEVSSSDDDEDNGGGRRDQSSSANKGPPETPKLSRELSALQLTSGTTPTTASSSIQVISSPRRGRSSHQQQQPLSRTRTSSEGCSNSDTENEAPNPELMPPKSLHHHDPISAKGNGSPKKVNLRYVKSKEAKKDPLPSVSDVCDNFGMNDVELDYTEADYQNLTTFKIFQQTYQSRIQGANPESPKPRLMMLLAAKWREFQAKNLNM